MLKRCLLNTQKLSTAVRCCASNAVAVNEPLLEYRRGSAERKELDTVLQEYQAKAPRAVPIVIGDQELTSDQQRQQVMPFDHGKALATYHYASDKQIQEAINVSLKAREKWENTSVDERCKIFLKAADLISGKYRAHLVATTMLGQGKTIYQAEIDAAAELADFLRFNVGFMKNLMQYSPISTPGVTNSMVYRGMEGFWAAVTPFNFTAIGGNLAAAPAIAGNTVVWKPTDTAMLSNYVVYTILREAGLPPGIINFVPADGPTFGNTITAQPELAGINFTGSVPTFKHLYKQVAQNLDIYKTYPVLIGECGGKNYHFAHPTADISNVLVSTLRSAFEYSGQKCSACSRAYIPQGLWTKLREGLVDLLGKARLGSPLENDTFLSAVIDEKAFDRIAKYIDYGKSSSEVELIYGGTYDKSKGYFITPTVFRTNNPNNKLMTEEIFGPVLTIYTYPDNKSDEIIDLVNKTSPFGLTGAIFSKNPGFIKDASRRLKQSAGNFYINNQSTGSVVGQQPFGGARLSGTNDKAGGPHYMLKFLTPQAVKTLHGAPASWLQPHME